MPGTGPLRRSSAPVRKKAIVDKSRIGARRLRSPRSAFVALVKLSFTGKVLLLFLGGLRRRKLLSHGFGRDISPHKAEVVLVKVTQQ